jgi:rRNA maturation RNase YbeY
MPVSVTTPRGLGRLSAPLRALVTQVLRGQGRRVGEVAVVIADDDLLHRINAEWRGIDRTTDVISFAYDENEPDAGELAVRGDVLVSMDRVQVQAKRYRVTPGAELARLVVHGALHLCGHDHMKAGERRLMRAAEAKAMRAARPRATELERVLAPTRRARATRATKPKSSARTRRGSR